MAESTPETPFLSAICGEAISLQEAKTDGDGKMVHGECFVQALRESN